jgi:hypothetical protein
VNAESFTPGCLLNARPALPPSAATVPPATKGARPGRAGAELPHLQKSGFRGPFSPFDPKSDAREAKFVGCYGRVDVPCVYLCWSFRVPAIYPGLPFRWSRPSHGDGVGAGSTWRIVKATWRYLASFQLAGDPGAPGGPLGGCRGCVDAARTSILVGGLPAVPGNPGERQKLYTFGRIPMR